MNLLVSVFVKKGILIIQISHKITVLKDTKFLIVILTNALKIPSKMKIPKYVNILSMNLFQIWF